MKDTGKPQGTNNGHNVKGMPHATTKSQTQGFGTQGFGRTTSDKITVVIVNVYGQTVKTLPVTSEKTVWDCRNIKCGIYFYKMELHGKLVSGKIVINN